MVTRGPWLLPSLARRVGMAAAVVGGLLAASQPTCVRAQLAAFPGAEGAGKDALGGRGGDVYHVTTLADSGAGSLRTGITGAPAGGRTIVFDVGGTINLASALTVSGKSKLTIAGQTAPGGGITIANQQFRVNNSNNVIVQFLRVRPGSTFGSSDPDAIWISGSTDVMIDHVTTSWGVDETISVTDNSADITVQWSTMTQGLFNAGHTGTDGVGHSYGSLINGGDYTFHHNLYAHSKSRHPRAQASGNYLRLDWVNNVIYNPQDRFGYSDSNDPYDMNMVGNYGIKGPGSGSNNALMRPEDTDSHFWVSGNYTDLNQNGVIDGSAINGTAVFGSGDTYTLDPARLSTAQLPLVTTTSSAEQAYIQVLSRAGAINYRDPIDRRTMRTIFNQLDGRLQTQADWGGWPAIPNGSPAPDANGDGVPDSYAISRGFATNVPLNTTLAPSGYSYLEEYLHSLTPHAYAPTNTVAHTISTAFGRGADAQLNENGGASATSSGIGNGSSLNALWSGPGGSNNQLIVLKFDLAGIEPGSITTAQLDVSASAAFTGTHAFKVYGLEHDAPGWDWAEGTVQFNGGPGTPFDSNSGTLAIDPTYTVASPPDPANLLTLGIFNADNLSANQTVSMGNPNLAVFLNLAAAFEGDDQDSLVTLILEQTNDSGSTAATFWSQEGNAALAPRLSLNATLAPAPPGIVGDFDDDSDVDADDIDILADMIHRGASDPGGNDSADLDGVGGVTQDDLDYMVSSVLETVYGDSDLDDDVDGADFDAWRIRDSEGGGIGWATGDWDGDNDVDGADFDHWRERLPSIGGAGLAAVPEPAAAVSLFTGLIGLLIACRKVRRCRTT